MLLKLLSRQMPALVKSSNSTPEKTGSFVLLKAPVTNTINGEAVWEDFIFNANGVHCSITVISAFLCGCDL